MAILRRGKNTFLIRIYLGRDPVTKNRRTYNVTFHGTIQGAKKLEAILKGEKHSQKLVMTSNMTVNEFLDLYLKEHRHTLSASSKNKLMVEWRCYIRPYIGSIKIGNLKLAECQALFNFLLDPKEAKGE